MAEGVVALNRCAAWIRDDPRTKAAGGVDGSGRLRVIKLCIENHRNTRADAFKPEFMDEKFERQLVGLVGLEGEARVGTLDGVDDPADIPGFRWRGSSLPRLRIECALHMRARRKPDVEAFESNLRYMDGLSSGIPQRRMK